MATAEVERPLYKGKVTRSWPQLPAELVRLIATFYLHDLATTSYTPKTWNAPDQWYPRMIYTSIRDALEFDRCLMKICPQWKKALDIHLFFHESLTLLDPTNHIRHTPYPPSKTVLHTLTRSCLICRLNAPLTSLGLLTARKCTKSPYLGYIPLCDTHDRRKTSFCGACLRVSGEDVVCLENEDEDTFPGVEATCRDCRREWLKKRGDDVDVDKVTDWEARAAVEGFVELAEGGVKDVLGVCRDKLWLGRYTRLSDMMLHAAAAEQYSSSPSGSPELEDEEEEEEHKMRRTEESVRDLALGDWARNRIVGGWWISPADVWFGHRVGAEWSASTHPCPWTLEVSVSPHPKEDTVRAPVPPSYDLCEQAYVAYQRMMKIVLGPAMRNVVRKIVVESALRKRDAAVVAARMDVEEVVRVLREEEGVWFDGVDWAARWRRAEKREEGATSPVSTESTSTSSSGKESGSPVVSVSTVQTTPSPPPGSEDGKPVDSMEVEQETSSPLSIPIPISPTLDPPQLLWPIPYVPVTTRDMPHSTVETIRLVWRESCAPLYMCRCSICERARAKLAPPPPPVVVPESKVEEEVEEEFEEEEEEEEDIDLDSIDSYPSPTSPPLKTVERVKKRGSEELESEEGEGGKRVRLSPGEFAGELYVLDGEEGG